jgi:trk system potassium uptake protein TrkA
VFILKKKQFIVIGLGRFGRSVAITLSKLGHDVLAVDTDEDKVQEISENVTHAVQLNAMNEKNLLEIGVKNFEIGIVSIGADIQANIFVSITLKQLGVNYVIAKAQNEKHAEILKKIGVDKVVLPEHDMGTRLAYNLTSTSILDFIELSEEYNVVEIQAPALWHNKSIIELNLRAKYKINILAIKSETEKINISPAGEDIIKPNDILIAIGEKNNLNKMIDNFK